MTLDIALPFYGDVDYLKQTVASILTQTDRNWRLIVVDDGYPDDSSPGWFESLNDSRISYQRNPKNLGANGNYRKCIELVTSEFCLIMGADDILLPAFVNNVNQIIESNKDIGFLHTGVEVIDETGKTINSLTDRIKTFVRPNGSEDQLLSGEQVAKSLMRGNWMYFPSIVWNTKLLQQVGFRSDLNVCQDLGLAVDMLLLGKPMYVSSQVVFQYRRHSGSDSSLKAISGERFTEEKAFYSGLSNELAAAGWNVAARSARFHATSRLHALTLIPKAIRSGGAVTTLFRHVFR